MAYRLGGGRSIRLSYEDGAGAQSAGWMEKPTACAPAGLELPGSCGHLIQGETPEEGGAAGIDMEMVRKAAASFARETNR